MGRIQSSVGLISGIPIQDTIDKLLSIAARPKATLENRVKDLKAQKLAVTELTALVIGVEFAMQRIGQKSLFEQTTVTAADDKFLAATSTGKPAVGSFVYTPMRLAQSHQLLSKGFASKTAPIGAGELTVGFGGLVDKGFQLDDLNGGAGVQRGKIRITDRSGDSATVDLRTAANIDDVLAAINTHGDIGVTAVVNGDRIKLIDTTGSTLNNLRVQEVGASTTAADLGLGGIDIAANEATGQDILRLYDDLALQRLNDGNGVNLRKGAADLNVTLGDGTSVDVDFFALKKAASQSTGTTAAKNGLNAQISFSSVGIGESYDGYKLEFKDDPEITAGSEKVEYNAVTKTFTVSIDAGNTRAAEVIVKLNADTTFGSKFTASNGAGGNGTGVVDVTDTLTSAGGAEENYNETTVADLMDTINRASPGKLLARISSAGDSLELVDLTGGASPFAVSSLFGGSVAADLGFTSAASAGVITGERRLGGLKTVLLDSLAGGYGVGDLGMVAITNRNGVTTNVDLSGAKTLEDAVTLVNAANAGVQARVNDARNGLTLLDSTGGVSNLVIADGDATNSATKLKIAANVAQSTVNSGSLSLQTFNENMTLAALRNGRGIGTGSFLMTDTNGNSGAINLAVLNAKNVSDIVDAINTLGIGVSARVNDTGDGLLLLDTAGGSGQITVADVGSGTAAKDLKLAGTSVVKTINGTPTHVIDGSYTSRITLDADDSLQDLITKLNAAGGDFTAALVNSGGGSTPYRAMINSTISGQVGELLVDGASLGITFQQTAAAQDALLLSGRSDATILGTMITSSTNQFNEVIDGVQLTINAVSETAQTISIAKKAETIKSPLKLFVDQYNRLREKISELSDFNPENKTAGVLFSTTEILQIELEFAQVLTSRYFSTGAIQSFEQIGVSPDSQGTLQFDESKFQAKYEADPADVEQFFTTAGNGGSAKIVAASERLTARDNSILVNRANALQRTIDNNQRQINAMTATLDRQREQMVKQFARLEKAISGMQANLNWLSKIQPIAFPAPRRS
jgi:flagellar hook-associated protein 2